MNRIGLAGQSVHRLGRRLIGLWKVHRQPGRSGPARTNAPASSEPGDRLALTTMSFNIRRGTAKDGRNHWQFRRHLVQEVLTRYRPDVLGLQEALYFQIAEIRTMLPGYAQTGRGHLGGSQGLHNAIFYDTRRFSLADEGTFWLSDTPEKPGSKGWGNILPRTCTWVRLIARESGQAFYFYNTHLDHISPRSRKRSVVFLAERIRARSSAEPFILTGDFNAREQSKPIRYLKGEAPLQDKPRGKKFNPDPLMDSFRVQYPNHRTPATFHGFGRYLFRLRLDYIFVPQGVQVREAKIIQLRYRKCYPSDHFPLLTQVCLPPPSAASALPPPGDQKRP